MLTPEAIIRADEPIRPLKRTVSRHQRGEIITTVAFPDVAIAVSEILPPR